MPYAPGSPGHYGVDRDSAVALASHKSRPYNLLRRTMTTTRPTYDDIFLDAVCDDLRDHFRDRPYEETTRADSSGNRIPWYEAWHVRAIGILGDAGLEPSGFMSMVRREAGRTLVSMNYMVPTSDQQLAYMQQMLAAQEDLARAFAGTGCKAGRPQQGTRQYIELVAHSDISDPAVLLANSLVLQLVVGKTVDEGRLIEIVTVPWFDIVDLIARNPQSMYEIPARKWEEIVAGAYKAAGFDEVILTPQSGDYGRDVIAIKKGLGQVRVIDQVKAFRPPHVVTADDVRALLGVLQGDGASKGFLTTTSDFAPKLRSDPLISPFVPSRLELVDGTLLVSRLRELARARRP
jgi:restriction system protein